MFKHKTPMVFLSLFNITFFQMITNAYISLFQPSDSYLPASLASQVHICILSQGCRAESCCPYLGKTPIALNGSFVSGRITGSSLSFKMNKHALVAFWSWVLLFFNMDWGEFQYLMDFTIKHALLNNKWQDLKYIYSVLLLTSSVNSQV